MQRTIVKWSLGDPLPHNFARGNIAMSQLNAASMMRSDPIPTRHNYMCTSGVCRYIAQYVTMKLVETELFLAAKLN